MKEEEESYVPTIFPWNQNSEDRTTKNSELSRIPLQSLDNRFNYTGLDSSGSQIIYFNVTYIIHLDNLTNIINLFNFFFSCQHSK